MMRKGIQGVSISPYWASPGVPKVELHQQPMEGTPVPVRMGRYDSEGCLVMSVEEVCVNNNTANPIAVTAEIVMKLAVPIDECGADWSQILEQIRTHRLVAVVPISRPQRRGIQVTLEGPLEEVTEGAPGEPAVCCPDCGLSSSGVVPGRRCPNPVCPGVGSSWFKRKHIDDDGNLDEGKWHLFGMREAKLRGPEILAAAQRCFEKWRET